MIAFAKASSAPARRGVLVRPPPSGSACSPCSKISPPGLAGGIVSSFATSQPLFHGDARLILADGTRLTVTRVYREKLDQLIARLE